MFSFERGTSRRSATSPVQVWHNANTIMTILDAAMIPSLALAVALAGCSPGNDDPMKHEDGSTAAEYRPLTTDYAPNFMARTSIGRVMTTPQGATIYTFGNDDIGKSNCHAHCATQWPPIIAAADARPTAECRSSIARMAGGNGPMTAGRSIPTQTMKCTEMLRVRMSETSGTSSDRSALQRPIRRPRDGLSLSALHRTPAGLIRRPSRIHISAVF